MSVKEDLGDTRPYWKVLVSLVFSLTATVLFIYVGIKAIFYFMPFVIGWILSVIAGPLVTFLEKKLKIMKRLGSAITIILVLALCIGLIVSDHQPDMGRNFGIDPQFSKHVS